MKVIAITAIKVKDSLYALNFDKPIPIKARKRVNLPRYPPYSRVVSIEAVSGLLTRKV